MRTLGAEWMGCDEMYPTLLVVLVVLQSAILLALVTLVVMHVRSLSDTRRKLTEAVDEAKDHFIMAAEDLRTAVKDADDLVLSAKTGVDSFSRLVVSAERLVEATSFLQAAEKAVTSSRTTFVSLLQGVKAGLQALRSKKDEQQEVSEDGTRR